MSVFDRRNEIVEIMRVRKFDTAQNLAFEFGVCWRTIINDVLVLSTNGHPIISEAGRGGGIRWVGGKRGFTFTEREVVALHTAIAIVPHEYKAVLENLIRERVKVKSPFEKDDIYGILRSGITQRALAAVLGITESHLSRVLSGQKKPSESLVARILQYKQGVAVNESV